MSIAMHGPNGEYEAAQSDEREQELRAEGWIDGHEHFSKQVSEVEGEKSEEKPSDQADKPLDKMTKAELLEVAKQRGIQVNSADKKEVILAAVIAPEQV